MKTYSDDIWEVLACPYCKSGLQRVSDGVRCATCDTLYSCSKFGSLDFRLKKPKRYQLQFELGNELLAPSDISFKKLPINSLPEVDFSDVTVPWHLTKELLSYFPKAKNRRSLMLDLGCGSAIHREVCELAGFQYVGLDYASNEATMLGDAHALPFKTACFEFVLSIAVIEHLKYPHIALQEVYRILKPRAHFIGTVAFLEPFHGLSYYHHSHLGMYTSLKDAGFNVDWVSPSCKWTGIRAQASMGLFPKMPEIICSLLILPLDILHKFWWKIGSIINPEIDENKRLFTNSGSISFVAWKI